MIDAHDVFQFGSGKPQVSKERAYFPASFKGQKQQGVFGVTVLDAGIPFLARNTLLGRLGCILDMPKGIIHFSEIDVTLPLRFHMGHIVVAVASFPENMNFDVVWGKLSDKKLWHDPDPELVILYAPKPSVRELAAEIVCKIIPMQRALQQQVPPEWLQSWRVLTIRLMTDDGGTEDVQVNVSTCSPEVVPQSLVDPGDESRGRLRNGHSKDSGGDESRSKDLPAPEVPQVRQPPREFQRMPPMLDEVPVQ